MSRNARWGLILLVIGILWNNYIYLHDLITWNNDGFIFLGWKSWVGLAIAAVLIIAGLVMLLRRPETGGGSEGVASSPGEE